MEKPAIIGANFATCGFAVLVTKIPVAAAVFAACQLPACIPQFGLAAIY